MTATVLVTGFEPFDQHKAGVNPSWQAVRTLPQHMNGVALVVQEMPVEYAAVKARVPETLAQLRPACVVHVGVGKPGDIRLERLAHNDGYARPDNRGEIPPAGMAVPECQIAELRTSIDVDALLDRMQATGWSVTASTDPGRYLCDFIYFTSLHICSRSGTPCLFVHVPPAGKQYSQEEINSALHQLVGHITKML
ncbi:Pyroglutamyl-peptidase 1 [Polyrhizophydium stewartii]|uniref:Pyroglutamyl-peptidase 1 n=1 Tax=Polyrhizophydium stewartii TaxID=2732419 RepID=A0ABR4MXA7_9FUNG